MDVVEQRVSNFLQSVLTLCFCTIPALLLLLGSIPVAVLNGLFIYMGLEAFSLNVFLARLFYLLLIPSKVAREQAHEWPYSVGTRKIAFFVTIQLLSLGLIFGVTLSPVAIAFPIAIVLLVFIRQSLGSPCLGPFQMTLRDLQILDGSGVMKVEEEETRDYELPQILDGSDDVPKVLVEGDVDET